MKDNDIKKKLDESLSNYQIKTTSHDILEGYYNQEEKVVSKKRFPFFKVAIPTLAIALSCVIAFVAIPHGGDTPTPPTPPHPTPKYNSRQNQTAFSLFSGMNIVSSLEPSVNVDLKKMMNHSKRFEDDEDDKKIDEVSFNQVVDAFDPCVEVFDTLFENSINVESTLTKGEFKGQFATYPYKLEVDSYVLYTNITLEEEDDDEKETSYLGEIVISESLSYKVELNLEEEVENQESEQEIEMKIIYDQGNYLLIEQETEVNERSYTYSLFENQVLAYHQEISFEDDKDKNDSIDAEIIKGGIAYSFDNIVRSKAFISASYQVSSSEQEGTFQMEEKENIRSYLSNSGEKIEIVLK